MACAAPTESTDDLKKTRSVTVTQVRRYIFSTADFQKSYGNALVSIWFGVNNQKTFEANDPLVRERGLCLEKDCKVKKLVKDLQTCQDRVQSRSQTAETCQQEVIDLMVAVDHCVGKKAFRRLA